VAIRLAAKAGASDSELMSSSALALEEFYEIYTLWTSMSIESEIRKLCVGTERYSGNATVAKSLGSKIAPSTMTL